MIQAWQTRLLNNKPFVTKEYKAVGSYTDTLGVGDYLITVIGGGGGGVGAWGRSGGTFDWGQGGVGGTLQVKVSISKATQINVVVGAGGRTSTQSYQGVVSGWGGTDGVDSYITGIPNVTLRAGAGTAASFVPTSISGGTRTLGKQGTNTISGVKEIVANNTNKINAQGGAFSTTTTRAATGLANTNWPENTLFGAGGDAGYTTMIQSRTGGSGYVLIETI